MTDAEEIGSTIMTLDFDQIAKFIEQGKAEVERGRDKDIVVFLGLTGVGKTVFLHFLCNILLGEFSCEEKSLQDKSKKRVIDVVDDATRIAPIGHNREATTFIPNIYEMCDHGITLCDTAGLFDNRQIEMSIASTVTMQHLLRIAGGVKFILLMCENTVNIDKDVGFSFVLPVIRRLFQSESDFIRHSNSILLGITKVPRPEEGDVQESIVLLEEKIAECREEYMHCLAKNIFIFDPLDRNNRKYKPICERNNLFEKLKQTPYIRNQLFRVSVLDRDYVVITTACHKLGELIKNGIRDKQIDNAAKYYKVIVEFKETLNHEAATTVFGSIQETVKTYKLKRVNSILTEMKRVDAKNLEALFKEFVNFLQAFKHDDDDDDDACHIKSICDEVLSVVKLFLSATSFEKAAVCINTLEYLVDVHSKVIEETKQQLKHHIDDYYANLIQNVTSSINTDHFYDLERLIKTMIHFLQILGTSTGNNNNVKVVCQALQKAALNQLEKETFADVSHCINALKLLPLIDNETPQYCLSIIQTEIGSYINKMKETFQCQIKRGLNSTTLETLEKFKEFCAVFKEPEYDREFNDMVGKCKRQSNISTIMEVADVATAGVQVVGAVITVVAVVAAASEIAAVAGVVTAGTFLVKKIITAFKGGPIDPIVKAKVKKL